MAKLMKLIHGVPHKRNCRIVTNTSRSHKDNFPLSGDGLLQLYNLVHGVSSYVKYPLPITKTMRKGMNERSFLPMKNFSNTSVVCHNNHVYTLFDYDYFYKHKIDSREWETGNYRSGVHMKKYNGDLYSFSNAYTNKTLHVRKNHEIISVIKLDSVYYVHDFVKANNTLYFPMYKYKVDVPAMLVGSKSVVEAVQFDHNEPFCMLSYNLETKEVTTMKLPYIKGPVFHIAGYATEDATHLLLFELNQGFQLKHMNSKTGYDSNCVHLVLNKYGECSNVSCYIETGDMPFQENEKIAYVSDSKLIITNLRTNTQKTYEYPGEQMEEPKILDKFTYLISHGKDETFVRIYDSADNLISVYNGKFTAEQSFHGDIVSV